jgi:hypothetical protein
MFTAEVLSLAASTADHAVACLTLALLPDADLLLDSADKAALPDAFVDDATMPDAVCLKEAGVLDAAEEIAAEAADAAATVCGSLEKLKLIPALATVEAGELVTCVSDAIILATDLDEEETDRAAALKAEGDAGVPDPISLLTACTAAGCSNDEVLVVLDSDLAPTAAGESPDLEFLVLEFNSELVGVLS